MRIVVKKGQRRLRVYREEEVVFSCAIALGGCPIGPKEREGDERTPEGWYEISCKNAQSKYHLSLGISYPNAKDADRALRRGEISEQQCRDIMEKAPCPPWNTPLGGAVFLHGGGVERDWTKGCIAVENSDMEWLFEHIPIGTKIWIQA